MLPGTAQTYPTGGLHARYYNDVAVGGLVAGAYLAQAETPAKDNPASRSPLRMTWSSRRRRSVSRGACDVRVRGDELVGEGFRRDLAAVVEGRHADECGAERRDERDPRVGRQNRVGTQLLDQWTLSAAANYNFTVPSAALGGKEGWYPFIIEVAAGRRRSARCPVRECGRHAAVRWTDPGGTVFTSGGAALVCPSTSLSPLGCVDQRYQGVSYFDMYQQTGNAFGYQFACEPMQLEASGAGVFPGNLCPRIREGHDTDEICGPTPRTAVAR